MRSRTSNGKGGKYNRNKGSTAVATENLAIMGGITHDCNPIVTPHPFEMNLVLPGWNSMETSGLTFCTVLNNACAPPLLNTHSASNVSGVMRNHGFSTAPVTTAAAPAPQVNYYVVGASPNGFQSLAPSHVNGQLLFPPTVNGGGNGASGGAGNPVMSAPSFLQDVRTARNAVPSFPNPSEGVSRCSVCSATFGAMELVYLFPQDNAVMCTRCSSQRVAGGDASQVTRGTPPFIVPQSNLGSLPQPSVVNPTMLLNTLPPYMPVSNLQNPLMPQVPQLPY
ncbi:hypothetical protein TraAM80_06793 [Trypanosoma rangeli]|uniref:Uncharacterized protein n=1 Tax=Trypanosoma rangeli TaxID=5698 RepID=A0A422N8S0_TRYRA|nr:uncharacterized protein TraAM80_06793 [Trypanosoma rangeli]RNF01855.1 hypothetical protein TraAM80_06793 [Trypanosoma rangeli]|eukprot:RNF01855.1 hypothetical protein TraAM80_06793 [Trypanosoma rangeli]